MKQAMMMMVMMIIIAVVVAIAMSCGGGGMLGVRAQQPAALLNAVDGAVSMSNVGAVLDSAESAANNINDAFALNDYYQACVSSGGKNCVSKCALSLSLSLSLALSLSLSFSPLLSLPRPSSSPFVLVFVVATRTHTLMHATPTNTTTVYHPYTIHTTQRWCA
jgi:hypothetical protein